MFDPLSSSAAAFGGSNEEPPPWPTTPHLPNSPIPHLGRGASPKPPSTPEKGPAPGPYGKQPQIYGQPEAGLISPRDTPGANGARFERGDPYLRVRITGLDRNRRDILVKFDAQTNLSNFTGTTYRNVSRSYLEFQQFYESIVLSNPQTIVPALPLAQTSAPTDEEDDRLVRIMLQRWMARICEDPILLADEDLRSFIESDFGYQPTPRPRRKTSSGFSLIRRGVPDEDEELQRARFELTKLEGQFFETARAVDKLAIARKTLAGAHAEMGNKLINVAITEAHPPLANAFRKIGRTWHSLADLDQAQAISECVVIGDSLGYQGMNARSAKETLQMRTGVLEEYQAAVKTTISKRRQIERLKASSNIRPEKVDDALEDMEEANKYEQVLARRAEGISQNLHRALETHNHYANDDITTALIEHARSSIMYERQLLRELESLRADVDNADKPAPPVANGVPRPLVVPPLEEFTRPPLPPQAQSAPGPSVRLPSQLQTPPQTATPQGPGLTASVTVQPSPVRPPYPEPPSSSASTQGIYSSDQPPSPLPPAATARVDPLSAPQTPTRATANTLPQSPGAGPSSPSPLPFAPSPIPRPTPDGPPLGGRFADGTKSMFIKPSPSPLASGPPLSASAIMQRPSGPVAPGPLGPLSAPTSGGTTNGSFDPLMGGAIANAPTVSGQHPASLQNGLDPLGQFKPAYSTASVRVNPQRPRLDAKEAASKLANMF
ncbi:Vps5 C terminal like-domain-containing protein [Schizophyllum amplum]|uniref:Vps5 C terminal like-domain-containing protein n=1 Tax=Schizophyllum amplum TaxID=97359 RepID=A0A550CTP6_9AGAR|nr:Vps5 C terminal like-domain-containing protein [Auriculariopsis ampla]